MLCSGVYYGFVMEPSVYGIDMLAFNAGVSILQPGRCSLAQIREAAKEIQLEYRLSLNNTGHACSFSAFAEDILTFREGLKSGSHSPQRR